MMETLSMGDYGAYVWSSFGLTLIVLVICVVQAKRRHTLIYNAIKTRLMAMEADQ